MISFRWEEDKDPTDLFCDRYAYIPEWNGNEELIDFAAEDFWEGDSDSYDKFDILKRMGGSQTSLSEGGGEFSVSSIPHPFHPTVRVLGRKSLISSMF